MRKLLGILFLILPSLISRGQNLSFSCPKDTILGCNNACFTIKGRIPDIHSLTDNYTFEDVTTISVCRPYDPPALPGQPTSLTVDDTYSTAITIPFTFPFFGVPYTSLVASTNGYLSFDVALAGAFSPWSLAGGDVPNAAYAGAMIMGPWHDIDPGVTTSPNRQIKYNVIGTAPTRKWVLSYYKVPLFSAGCNPLIDNTHQIVLHEATGIIEVFIQDKQQCPGWNNGKAMVGLQNMAKTIGIMPPGRRATDPPWGVVGMNEVWRFYPSNGPTLYRSVVLLDGTGTQVAVGDTVRVDENTFETSFPNICPPPGNSIYVIKTSYQRIDDPTATLFSLDTINVVRQPDLPVSATMTPTTCGASTGTITVTASGTPPYQYSLDGGALGNNPVFSGVGAGNHTVSSVDGTGCTGTATIDVTSVSSLPSTNTPTDCSCPGRNDGSITVTPGLGTGPFTYTISGAGTLPAPITVNGPGTFTNLPAGTYTISFEDALNCTGTTPAITIEAGAAISSTTVTASSCPGLNNGSATITATSGTGPYTFVMTGYTGTPPPPGPSATFTNLASTGFGLPYNVTITDATGCTGTRNVFIFQSAGLTGTITSTPATCSTVSNGTLTVTPTSGSGPYTYALDGSAFIPSANPTFITLTGVSSGNHSVVIKDNVGCTGTLNVIVNAGAGVNASAVFTPTNCPNVANGTINVNTTTGTAPFTYSLDGGPFIPAASPLSTFLNVASGPHTINVRDANGCTGTTSVTITSGPALTGTFTSTVTSCPGVSDGTVTVTPTSGTAPYTYQLDGGPFLPQSGATSHTFTNVSSGAHLVTLQDGIGCTGTVPTVVGAGPGLTAVTSNANPPCSGIADGSITIIPSLPGNYSFTLTPAGGGGVPVTQNNPTFAGLAPGPYTYAFTSLTSGCQGSGVTSLSTNPPITTTVSLTMPLCNGASNGIITLNPAGGVAPYEYSSDGGANFQNNSTFNTIPAGAHLIRIRDNEGCIKDTLVTLAEPTRLQASAFSTPGTCNGNDGNIIVTGSDGTPGYTYSINNGASYQNSNQFTVSGGSYPDVRVKDANGCVANTSVNVTLIDNMVIAPLPDTTICVGSTVRLIPLVSPEATVFQWSTPEDSSLVSTLNNPNIRTPDATPQDTVTYAVIAVWGVCARTDTVRVNILHKPVPHAGDDVAVCNYKRDTVLVGSVSDSSGPVLYAWTPANTATTPDQAITVVNPDSTQLYTLTVTDDYGCNFSVSDFVQVTVQPPVPANAGRDTIAVVGVPHQLIATGGVSYAWTPSSPLNNPSVYNPLATLTQDQLFVVVVTDAEGCLGSDSVFIQAYNGPRYYLPNSFTPNGDGMNDVFRAVPVGIKSTEYFRVFNRFGQLVFQTNRWLKGWDGTYQGAKQPSGTYIWMIKGTDKDGKIIEKQGTVMLLN